MQKDGSTRGQAKPRPITDEHLRKLRGSLKGGKALKALLDERRQDRDREDRKPRE